MDEEAGIFARESTYLDRYVQLGVAGGRRLLALDPPTARVEVGGKTLVGWTLDKLAEAGVERAVVNVHHHADDLIAHLTSRTGGPEVVISDERGRLMDTGGGLVKAAPLLGTEPVFVCNIDALWIDGDMPELGRLAAGFDSDIMDFRLLLSPLGHNLGFPGEGDFHCETDGRIVRRGKGEGPLYAYSGIQVMDPRVLEGHPEEPFSTNALWDIALRTGRAYGTPMRAFWMHVGDPESRDAAQNRLDSLGDDPARSVFRRA